MPLNLDVMAQEAVVRRHCVSVRLNDPELEQFEVSRGRLARRGEWLRMAAFGQLPANPRPTVAVPEVNTAAWADLARLAANIDPALVSIDLRDADNPQDEPLEGVREAIAALRRELVGVRS